MSRSGPSFGLARPTSLRENHLTPAQTPPIAPIRDQAGNLTYRYDQTLTCYQYALRVTRSLLRFAFYLLNERFDLVNQRRQIGPTKTHLWRRNTVMFDVRGNVFVVGWNDALMETAH